MFYTPCTPRHRRAHEQRGGDDCVYLKNLPKYLNVEITHRFKRFHAFFDLSTSLLFENRAPICNGKHMFLLLDRLIYSKDQMCPLIYFLFETSNLLYRPGNKVERSENKFGFSLKTLLCKLVFDHLYTYIINTEILDGQFLNWTTI